jgi:type I restriction enzyme S subunit
LEKRGADRLLVRPPLVEQRGITGFLQRSTEELDTLVTDAESAITLLQERRTALISAAVTGKIDVRGMLEEEAA